MAIDPSIPLQIQQPQSPLVMLNQLGQMAQASQARQLQGQQIQQNALALKTQNQTVNDQQAARDAAQGAVGADGKLDRNVFFSKLQQTAPHLIPQFQQEFAKVDKEETAAQQAADAAKSSNVKANLENAAKHLDLIGQHAQAALSAPPQLRRQAITGSLQQLTQLGVMNPQEAQGIGQQISGMNDDQLAQFLQTQANSAIAGKDQITAKLQQQDADERERHNKADEANTRRGQDMTAGTARRGQDMQYGSFAATLPPGVTGDKALLAMPLNMASTVKAIGDGKMSFETMTARMPPAVKANLAAAVLAYKPDYDQSNFSAAKAANVTAAKSEVPTNLGNQKVAFNTAIAHADLLDKAAAALNNGDQQTLNSLKNRFENEFGSTGPVTAQVIAQAYTREANKMLTGGHVTDSEISAIGKTLDVNSQNLAQVRSVLGAYRSLAKSKLDQLNAQKASALGQGAAPAAPAGVSNIHVNPQTGAKIGWDGTKWVNLP